MARSDAVQRVAIASWQEPLDAYRRVRAAGLHPFLLDGAGAHPDARYAFLALRPLVEARISGRDIEERWTGGAMEFLQEEPLGYLRRLAERFAVLEREDAPFTGGIVGLFGFGFARAVEPSLPLGADPGGAPDALLWVCPDALVFDRRERTLRIFCADVDGDVAVCDAHLANLRGILDRPLPPVGAQARAGGTSWSTSLDKAGFECEVRGLRGLIHEGDLFQANLATRFSAPCVTDPADLFAALLASNPSPYMALVEARDVAVVSGSPELLFSVQGGVISSRPIAGTRKRGIGAADEAMARELRRDAKEQAEHTMLVDLVRNDVARVSRPGTVCATETASVERYSHVMHLASRVEGQVRSGTGFADWLAALFPGGTVTGAPKVRAVQRILEAEPVARGFYTGSAGYLSWSQNAAWNILIRTMQIKDGVAHVHAGSGIVADSDPSREWREAGRKAQALLDAATGPPSTHDAGRLGDVESHGAWSPPHQAARHGGKRVLLVDNYDSFVHNLADYVATLGATVHVVRNDGPWRQVVAAFRPTHVILSPGPGWPDGAGCTLEVARELSGILPILGVCLGHQAIGQGSGARVQVHPNGPVHGKADKILHTGAGLFAGLPSPIEAARYHSLVVDPQTVGPDWIVDATLADGTVMALRHRTAPTFGLQFHPESLCTPRGLELLDKFLETAP
ncbi:MAG: chorismate-binding protein [bacterium]